MRRPLALLTATTALAAGAPALAEEAPEAPAEAAAAAEAPAEAAEATDRSSLPGPLEARPFVLPTAATATLSNGLRVAVVENHEVPLVAVRLIHNRGGFTDGDGKRGLASAAMDMLNEGAGGLSAEQISTAARELGGSVSSSAGMDGGGVSLSVLSRNLGKGLDLMATVALRPDFPEADWSLMQKKRIQELKSERDDPNAISSRVLHAVMYSGAYVGDLVTEADYEAITVDDLRGWHAAHLSPTESLILVGGDTTLAEVQPLLEASFGGWAAGETAEAPRPAAESMRAVESSVLYLVDKPGAAQSVVKAATFVGDELDADWFAFDLANQAIGGAFTARINMNLREDKGITYGARSGTSHNYLPGLWTVGASIRTDATTLGVTEILRELTEARADRPITQDELDNARGGKLGGWPLAFEQPGYLLGQTVSSWRYALGDDWLAQWIPRYEAVTLEAANAAFVDRIDPDRLVILVVGDAAVIRDELEQSTGLKAIVLDADGNPADG